MAVKNFIPEIWSARLLNSLDKAHVVTALVNRDFEGEIKQCGDKVRIASIGDIAIHDYSRNTDILDPEELNIGDQMLEITQQKYYNFQIDDVDRAQMRTNIMDSAMQKSGYALSDLADAWLANVLASGVSGGNLVGSDDSPEAIDASKAYTALVQLKTILDKNNVPTQERWALVPPEFHNLLLQDERFVSSGSAKADEVLTNGLVGSAAGFSIYMSNNLPGGFGTYKVIAGYAGAATYAEQVLETEAYRMEKRFADAVKGLHVYGAKVTRPEQLAMLTCSIDSGVLTPLSLTSKEGTASGKTSVSVNPALPSGMTAKYKTAASVSVPAYGSTLTGYTAFTADTDITATDGHDIVVAYEGSDGKVKAAGKTTVTAKA